VSLEQSWYQANGWSRWLWPLSVLFALLSGLRRRLYRWRILHSERLPVPVIVVGNISVGGTGKTPITAWLCHYLQQQGLQPGILTRGYGVKLNQPTLVTANAKASEVGDEPLLLAQKTGCPVMVWPNRAEGGRALLASHACQVLICDDGLQHYALARDFEIIVLDGTRGLGNGLLLPAGPLREGAWRLATAGLVLSNTHQTPWTEHIFQLQPTAAVSLTDGTKLPAGSKVHLVTGIGNPERFRQTVEAAGFEIESCRYWPDHHPFTANDFADVGGFVLMTEKDAVKCRPFAKQSWYALPVAAVLPAATETLLTQRLAKLRTQYGV